MSDTASRTNEIMRIKVKNRPSSGETKTTDIEANRSVTPTTGASSCMLQTTTGGDENKPTYSTKGRHEERENHHDDDHNGQQQQGGQNNQNSSDALKNFEEKHQDMDVDAMLQQLDTALVQACRQEKDRKWMLLVEEEFKELLECVNSKKSLEYFSLTSYHRLLLHRMCDWYGFQRQTLKNKNNTSEESDQRKSKSGNAHHGLRVYRGAASRQPPFSLAEFMRACRAHQLPWEQLGGESGGSNDSSGSPFVKIKTRANNSRTTAQQRFEHPAAVKLSEMNDLQQTDAPVNGPKKVAGRFAPTESSGSRGSTPDKLERPGLSTGSVKIKQRKSPRSVNDDSDDAGSNKKDTKHNEDGSPVLLKKEASYEEMRAKIFEAEQLEAAEEAALNESYQYGGFVPGDNFSAGMMHPMAQSGFPGGAQQNMQQMNQMYYPWMGFQDYPPYEPDFGEAHPEYPSMYPQQIPVYQQQQGHYTGTLNDGLNNLSLHEGMPVEAYYTSVNDAHRPKPNALTEGPPQSTSFVQTSRSMEVPHHNEGDSH